MHQDDSLQVISFTVSKRLAKLTCVVKKNVFNKLIRNLRFMQIEGKDVAVFSPFQTSNFYLICFVGEPEHKKDFFKALN